jgi:hypothetical protein
MLTDEATEALEQIREFGWTIVEARPAGTTVAARDRLGNPSKWTLCEPSFVAEKIFDRVVRESRSTPEDLLAGIRDREAVEARRVAS